MKHAQQTPASCETISLKRQQVIDHIGKGPSRFGGFKSETNVKGQLKTLPLNRVQLFANVTLDCEDAGIQGHFSACQILRVLHFVDFDRKKTMSLLKRMDPRHLQMTAQELESQLLSKTLLPIPSLRAFAAEDMFYMRPSRFTPGETTTSAVIANLLYVMDTFYERHRDISRSIGFIANMNDWTMENFNVDYCWTFMQGLQGRLAPVKVELFLIVNPPGWFDKVWNIMKPMLASGFRKKVHMIPEKDLAKFLEPGFEKHLPDEFKQGQVSLDHLAQDFVQHRRYVERKTGCRLPCPENKALLTSDKTERFRGRMRRNLIDAKGWYMLDATASSEECTENCFE